jgi:hypothetical protein
VITYEHFDFGPVELFLWKENDDSDFEQVDIPVPPVRHEDRHSSCKGGGLFSRPVQGTRLGTCTVSG